jgi:hypothetical protein
LQRLHYLEGFCRNVIKIELEKYVKETRKQKNTTKPKFL